jgi:hypothetical protein
LKELGVVVAFTENGVEFQEEGGGRNVDDLLDGGEAPDGKHWNSAIDDLLG